MLITQNVRLGRIIRYTWRLPALNIVVVVGAWALNEFFFKYHFQFPALLPTLLGTALAFSVGFNNNQAYDRWWEGRIIWGAIVNESRTWGRQCIQYIPGNPADTFLRGLVHRHIAFVHALRENLRNVNDEYYNKYLTAGEREYLGRFTYKCSAILDLQAAALHSAHTKGAIDGFVFMELNNSINVLCNEMGKSERIKNTVFPTTYNYYSKMFIWLLTASVTATLASTMGLWSIMFGFLTGYVFFTIHEVGNALLNPFVYMPTGLPLDAISRGIEINLLEMLGEQDVPGPIQPVNKEYVM